MVEMEATEEQLPKKGGRHRKKHRYNQILQQMEFYFSDSNLGKDRFLAQLLKDSPFVDLSIFLKFNKIRTLTQSLDDLQKALTKSEHLELSEDKTKVFRKSAPKVKQNVDECTIYVERIKPDATHEWLSSIFSKFGKVAYVSLPRYKHNRLIKGFAFVEFEKESEAQAVLEFFEKIDLKIPTQIPPEELLSIKTFEKDEENGEEQAKSSSEAENPKKRKHSEEEDGENVDKKVKVDEEVKPAVDEKKKMKKENKTKGIFKELGLHVLSKREWKAMRNKYLNMQREKMRQLKQHLNRARFSQKNTEAPEIKKETPENKTLEFVPGVIVKMSLEEPCSEVKKTKNDIKALSDKIKFVDAGVGCTEVFVRFEDAEGAKAFSAAQAPFESCLLQGDEEKEYWKKIEEQRTKKLTKDKSKPMRGRNKLLKKAEKVLNKHTVFDDGE